MKLYFDKSDPEICYPISVHKREMKENNKDTRTLLLAKKTKSEDLIWCRWNDSSAFKGSCGRSCKGYTPRNGKSGACKHLGNLYEPTDTEITI